MENNLQTHTIPAEPEAVRRLAALMGFNRPAQFEAALRKHTQNVRRVYDKHLKAEGARTEPDLPRQFQGARRNGRKRLTELRFRDPDKALRLLNEFRKARKSESVPARRAFENRHEEPGARSWCAASKLVTFAGHPEGKS